MISSNMLEVVHSYVCAPFEEKSLGGNKHFISFVDEHSRKMWIYLNKHYNIFVKKLSN